MPQINEIWLFLKRAVLSIGQSGFSFSGNYVRLTGITATAKHPAPLYNGFKKRVEEGNSK